MDKLQMTVLTNGTIDIKAAMGEAAKILTNHFSPLAEYASQAKTGGQQVDLHEILQEEEGGMGARTINTLAKLGIGKVGDLATTYESQLMESSGIGKKSIDEIKEFLASRNLVLGEEIPGWPTS